MSDSIKCHYCKKRASIHFTQIVKGKVSKAHLCESCAQGKGILGADGEILPDFISREPEVQEKPSIICKRCGFASNEFKKKGLLGCPACYDTFEKMLQQILKDMHKELRHKGKVPFQVLKRKVVQDQIEALDHKLQCAVNEERYEDAAHYRDQLNQLRSEAQCNPHVQGSSH